MPCKKTRLSARVEIPMTPMIDVVFQLLIFFIMSSKVVAPEGDFNVKMPLEAPSVGPLRIDSLPPIRVALKADPEGRLRPDGIRVGDRNVGDFNGLRREILNLIGDSPRSGSEHEVEFECDYDLKYDYVIQAVTAVTGRRVNGRIEQLVEKVKFTTAKKPT